MQGQRVRRRSKTFVIISVLADQSQDFSLQISVKRTSFWTFNFVLIAALLLAIWILISLVYINLRFSKRVLNIFINISNNLLFKG